MERQAAVARSAEAEMLRYRALFDASPDPSFVTDAAGRVLHANAAALDVLGTVERGLETKPLVAHVALTDSAAFRDAIVRARRDGTRLRVALRTPHGGVRATSATGVPLPGGAEIAWTFRLDDDDVTT